MRTFSKKWVAIVIMSFSGLVFADISQDYTDAQKYIISEGLVEKTHKGVTEAQTVLPKAPQYVEQEKYYDQPEAIPTDAAAEVSRSDSMANIITNDAKTHPKETINPDASELALSQTVQEHAASITDGTYKDCNKEIITENSQVVGTILRCGERFYCLDGSCQSTNQEKNQDFGKAITEVSAVTSAGDDVKKTGRDANTISIFAGLAAHCREVALGTLNCCADKGWAKGIFARCNSDEKKLGKAKEQGGLVVSVGRYCSTHVLGVCTEHKKSYCIFPSRIATDVQVGGRLGQLGRGFGDAKSPDCSGLTPNEISKIKMDQIDFTNAVDSVVSQVHLPDNRNVQDRIDDQIHQKIPRETE